ncbi:hypothetical protein H2204_009025 [Knufia peltigerae]|uniref:N-acetyltransferase domain-containing protein n=1 Tax=Knufia peltigerae TaxID=1002370 RepID=A0AA39CU48_9EURO|nr:hypothetical protein H2204_009025 [Knufia peltigerae]
MPGRLQYASPSDVPALVGIFERAFARDRATRLKAAGHQERPSYIGSMIEAPLRDWLDQPHRCRVLKLETEESLKPLGWICWGFYGLTESKVGSLCASAETSSIECILRARPGQYSLSALPEDCRPESKDPDRPADTPNQSVADLEALCSADSKQWMSRLMPQGGRGMFIASICIDPEHQGRGIGSELLQWGIRLADSELLSIWVHSSEDGWNLFASKGFEEIGRLQLDLGEYTKDDSLNLSDPYVYRYMVRRPLNS